MKKKGGYLAALFLWMADMIKLRTILSRLAGIMAATVAVLLWSMKPVYVQQLKPVLSSEQIFFLAGMIAAATSTIIWLCRIRQTGWTIFRLTSLSGLCIGLWYWAFYKALSGNVPAQATIIAFTWPLLGILAIRRFAPALHRPLRIWEYPLLVLAFIGAAITASGNSEEYHLLLYAALAAVSAGLYLPFALRAIALVEPITRSRVSASFHVISLLNLVALIVGTCLLAMGGHQLLPLVNLTVGHWLILALIGIATYLLSEILWCWGLSIANSTSVAAVAFFSPVLSVIWLRTFFAADVPGTAWIGLALVLAANLALHFNVVASLLHRLRPLKGQTEQS